MTSLDEGLPLNSTSAFLLLATLLSLPTGADEGPRYGRDVRPILSRHCFACHGPDARARRGDLRLDVREEALRVLEGEPGKPSEFLRRLEHPDPDERMPPPEAPVRPSEREIEILRAWVERGSPYEAHWAFVPPRRARLEDADGDSPSRIDALVRRRLLREGLDFSAPADRTTLIRRVTLDLTGLPPTPEEIAAFLSDDSPDAFPRLVDRLLASPRFGEHLAATWLEASRYADTDGYQNDRYRYQWAWRDWLIHALNRDLPYDRFVRDQIAGDLLPEATLHQQIATGFSRNHRINSEAGSIPEEWRVEYVADRVDTLGTVFLGLTLACARCHDHKYDPVSQRDYYRLFAYFNSAPEFGTGPNNGNSPPFIEVPPAYPEIATDLDRAREIPEMRWQKPSHGGGVKRPVPGDESTVMVLAELEKPQPTYLLARGQYDRPVKDEVLEPGTPDILSPGAPPARPDRLGLARWLTRPDHPLTARVAVNRVWQHFFGPGLVRTPENFGLRGELPSHPELLDDLAVGFVEDGWSVRRLCRRIVLTRTYRQSSRVSPELARRDPDNRLLARAPRLRLPAFVIRDQALAVSGLLVEQLYGPPVKPYMPSGIWKSISNHAYERDGGAALYRRSLYTYWRRTIPPPLLANFNAADREVCTVRQSRTNTPLQALSLLNNVVFVEASRVLAARLLREMGGSGERPTLARAVELVLGRPAREGELVRLGEDLAHFRSHFRRHPAEARTLLGVGERVVPVDTEPAELAAWTLVTSTLLNLEEAITRG